MKYLEASLLILALLTCGQADLHAEHGEKAGEELEPQGIRVAVAGRMMLKRVMGKASFATRDDRGQPASGDFHRQEVHQPRFAIPRFDPGRHCWCP